MAGRGSSKKYVRQKELGAGAFGKVYKVFDPRTNTTYAEKVVKCKDNEQLNRVLREMKTVICLSHPNIMKLHQAGCDQEKMFEANLCLIFEYCSRGTLNHRLQRTSTQAVNMKWVRQLSSAIAYIHSENLVHRDLKPENILLTNSAEDIKVGDFGLAREFASTKLEGGSLENYYMKHGCGTCFYNAPEVFSGHYTEKADVFSLGILLYAIQERGCIEVKGTKYFGAFVVRPTGGMVPLGMSAEDGKGLSLEFKKCDKHLARIICSALYFEPRKRASAAEIDKNLYKSLTV